VGISFSLFAEGSYAAKSVTKNIRHSFKLILLLLVPIAVIWAVFADKLLQVFGGDYSAEGAQLLRFFAASSIPASANLLYLGLARVEKNMKSLILVSAVTTVAMLGSTYVAISTLGILGVGVCWLVTQSAVAFFTTSKLLRKMRHASSQ
jgi:O-antigen/teichoic acid export membrane protein